MLSIDLDLPRLVYRIWRHNKIRFIVYCFTWTCHTNLASHPGHWRFFPPLGIRPASKPDFRTAPGSRPSPARTIPTACWTQQQPSDDLTLEWNLLEAFFTESALDVENWINCRSKQTLLSRHSPVVLRTKLPIVLKCSKIVNEQCSKATIVGVPP